MLEDGRHVQPDIFDLSQQIAHQTLEAAIDAIAAGEYPGWSVAYDNIEIELVRGNGTGQRGGSGISAVGEMLTPSSASVPARVWVVVLEAEPSARRDTLKFVLVGGTDDEPIWTRIRADSSTAAQITDPPDDAQVLGPPRRWWHRT